MNPPLHPAGRPRVPRVRIVGGLGGLLEHCAALPVRCAGVRAWSASGSPLPNGADAGQLQPPLRAESSSSASFILPYGLDLLPCMRMSDKAVARRLLLNGLRLSKIYDTTTNMANRSGMDLRGLRISDRLAMKAIDDFPHRWTLNKCPLLGDQICFVFLSPF